MVTFSPTGDGAASGIQRRPDWEPGDRTYSNCDVSGNGGRSAFGPEAEVGELHICDATPILRMTAPAYKRPFAEPKGCIGEGQQPANCSHSRCSKKSDRSVRSSLSCGHSLATPTSDIDVLLGFVSVPSCRLVECVLHTHWRASIRWRTDNELARGIREEWHHTL